MLGVFEEEGGDDETDCRAGENIAEVMGFEDDARDSDDDDEREDEGFEAWIEPPEGEAECGCA